VTLDADQGETMLTTDESTGRLAPADSTGAPAAIELRPLEPQHGEAVAQILYDAFADIHDRHRFARDFPTLESAVQLTRDFMRHPSIWGVVAISDNQVLGSNFLDERGPIRGVGPITVHPDAQGRGVGRQLMEAVLERGAGATGIRLLQDSFNTRSLSLYASLGFEVREPVAVMGGTPQSAAFPGIEVRPLRNEDLTACGDLHRIVHGFDRSNELRDALEAPAFDPFVAVRDSRVVAYATTLNFFPGAHGVAETERDMCALIAGALKAGDAAASFLLPTRQGEVLRWCLAAGLRVVKPMTYMSVGQYGDPSGAWIPSVLY
jgi:GNAT superfamily N-acetyltransferase